MENAVKKENNNHSENELSCKSNYDNIQTFRLIYFSVLASSIFLILPLALKVNGFGYIFFLSIILFHTIVETFIKLDEGEYVDKKFSPRVAFFADVLFVVPIIVIISYFVKYV